MLCSMCKKNTAVIFINKQGADGKAEVEGGGFLVLFRQIDVGNRCGTGASRA